MSLNSERCPYCFSKFVDLKYTDDPILTKDGSSFVYDENTGLLIPRPSATQATYKGCTIVKNQHIIELQEANDDNKPTGGWTPVEGEVGSFWIPNKIHIKELRDAIEKGLGITGSTTPAERTAIMEQYLNYDEDGVERQSPHQLDWNDPTLTGTVWMGNISHMHIEDLRKAIFILSWSLIEDSLINIGGYYSIDYDDILDPVNWVTADYNISSIASIVKNGITEEIWNIPNVTVYPFEIVEEEAISGKPSLLEITSSISTSLVGTATGRIHGFSYLIAPYNNIIRSYIKSNILHKTIVENLWLNYNSSSSLTTTITSDIPILATGTYNSIVLRIYFWGHASPIEISLIDFPNGVNLYSAFIDKYGIPPDPNNTNDNILFIQFFSWGTAYLTPSTGQYIIANENNGYSVFANINSILKIENIFFSVHL